MYSYFFILFLLLAGCDSGQELPESDESSPVARGTFTALLNGEPWLAHTTFYETNSNITLTAIVEDSTSFYYQMLSIKLPGDRLEVTTYPLSIQFLPSGGLHGALLSENDGDSTIQFFKPSSDSQSTLTITKIDRINNQFTGSFTGKFEVDNLRPDDDYQRLADTLMFTNGYFVSEIIPSD